MPMYVLGISAFYHDSAACLLRDGEIVAAAQEERFSRKKHDACFPSGAVRFCLQQGSVPVEELKYIVFYDKPMVKFERLLETYLAFSPKGIRSYLAAMPLWIKEKLLLKNLLKKELLSLYPGLGKWLVPPLLFSEHHESHAASAFYPSPFEQAAVLCMDGVGEWATTSAWLGDRASLSPLWEISFPHSLGLLYSAFTYYTGFRVNSGEYKVMGLAPYGRPKYVQAIYDHLLDLKPDGTFRLNIEYFNYCTGFTMTNGKFDSLFDGPARGPESPLTQREMDLARSVQDITEEVMLRLARTLHRDTGSEKLDEATLLSRIVDELALEKVVGWLHGPMEFGPRALGARSILGDPRSRKMQSIMNLKIKYRESFRPFAPSVLRERVSDYFDMDTDSPYMLLVAPVREDRRLEMSPEQKMLWGIDLLNVPRSDIPAVTHVDYSARVQTVHEDTNPRYHSLLKEFERKTGCGVLVNTSFNVRGEPLVCSPQDAYLCFMRTEMDVLVLENCILYKEKQKPLSGDTDWRREFELD